MSGIAKKRILSIGHSYVLGVNRPTIREIARDETLDVTVVAPQNFHGSLSSLKCEPEENSNIKLIPVATYFSQKIHFFIYDPKALYKVFKSQKWDLIHIWEEPYIFSGWQVARFAQAFNIPYFFWTAQNLNKKYPWPFSFFEKQVLEKTSGWLACGNLVQENLVQKKKYPQDKSEIVNLAVDVQHFQPLSKEEKEKKKKEIGVDGLLLGYLGRLTNDKGISLILEVLEKIKDDPSWSFVFWGSGEEKENIEKWAQEQNLQNRVSVQLLKHNEVPNKLPILDVLLAPSQTMPHWREQFGRMIVEAFASGVPVISSDSGEIPFVMGDAGEVLPEKDVDLWEQKIREVIKKPEKRQTMREKGLFRAKSFSAQKIASHYIQFYEKVLKEKNESI